MNRVELLNKLCGRFEDSRYLEIGCMYGTTYTQIDATMKTGVDPQPRGDFVPTYPVGSDEFFRENLGRFDVIFIDGLHLREQFLRDVDNSLAVLSPNGYIICHDMNPTSERHQRRRPVTKVWNGDVWKGWVTLRSTRKDLDMCVLDCDEGLGIIKRGTQETLRDVGQLTWDTFVNNREYWLNMIPSGSRV